MFNTFNSDIDKTTSKIGMLGKSFWAMKTDYKNGNGLLTSIFGGSNVSKNDKQKLLDYATALKNDVKPAKAWATTMKTATISAQTQAKACGKDTAAMVDLANSFDKATLSAKAAAVGMKALSMAGTMLLAWGVTEVLSLVVEGIDSVVHAEENARKRSEELTSSYETEKKNIDDNIAKYKELSEKLKDNSLSTSEAKSIKEQLLGIQDDLNEKYGAEATQIDLVNGKYDEQIKKLDALAKKKAGDYVAENYSSIKADEKYVSEKFNVNKSLGFKGSQANPNDYSDAGFDFKKYLDRYDKLDAKVVNPDGQYGMSGTVNLVTNGTRQEVYDQISSLLQDLNEDFGKSNPDVVALTTTLSNILNDSFDTDELANANSRIKKYAEAEILSNDKASKSYNYLVDAVDNYNTALETGKGVDEAKQKLLETKQAAEDSTKDITNSGKVLQDVYDSLSNEAPIEFQVEVGKNVDEKLKQSYDATINRFKSDTSDTSSKELDSLNKQLDEQTQSLANAKENLQNEYDKISDWGLDDYADQIKNDTIQTKFGNVDMDKRTIIHWSDELKQTYADALASWDYDPEVGSIDTVFGGSERFGEELNGNGWEVAFTPILPDGTFLSKDTVEEYINSILEEAYADDGKVTEDELTAIDAQGRQVGNTFVQGIFAGIDDSQNYDDNGNWAETVGRLMHFSGKFGAKQIADQGIDDANAKLEETKKKIEEVSKGFDDSDKIKDFFDTEGINTDEEIDEFNKVTEGIKRADDAIQKWNEHKKEAGKDPISISTAVDEINTKLKPVFDDLQSAYAKIFEIDDGKINFSLKKVDISMFESVKKSLDEISKAGAKIDNTVYENFVKTLSNSSSTQEQVQKSFNDMANSIINASGCMQNLNEETKNLMISSLKGMGVTNAEAIVNDKISTAKQGNAMATQFLEEVETTEKNTGKEVNSVSEDTVKAFLNKQTASENAKLKMLQLVAANERFNNTTLDVSQKIENLRNLALAAGQAGAAIATALNLENDPMYSLSQASDAVMKTLGKESHFTNDYAETIYKREFNKFQNLITDTPPSFDGNTGSNAPKSGSSSQKEHETDDEYHNPFDAKISDYEKGAEKYEDTIEKINNQIEDAYKRGDDELAKSLEQTLSSKQDEYQKYLANSSQALRQMTQTEVLPLLYEIVPEIKGKNFEDINEQEKTEITKKLNDAILEEKNKVTDLENAKKSDDKSKVSDEEIKSSEMKKKKYESLLSTLEKLDELVGNKSGEGSFSDKFRDTANDKIDKIKDKIEEDINKIDFKSSLFEDMDNQEGQMDSALKKMALYHQEAEEYRKLGVAEDSSLIQDTQTNYRETFKKIFELGNETFDKLLEKRDDLLSKFDFKLEILGEKEYDERIDAMNKQMDIHKQNIEDIVKERKKLTEQYRNNTIVAADYEERIRELKESERDNVQEVKNLYEAMRDIEISKLDDQIDDINKATEKQTKAIEKQIEALEKQNDELEKQKDLYDKAYSAVQKVVNDQLDDLDKQKEKEEEYWDDKLEALDKINEENQRAIELAEKQKAVQEASQRTSMVYHEDTGWQYEANPNEVSNAQQEMQQWLIDDQYEQAKKSMEEQKEAALQALDDQIEAWNDYLEKWEDAIDIYENEMNDAAAKTVIGINYVSKVLAQNTGIINKFGNEYAAILRKIGDENTSGNAKEIADLNKQKDEIEKASEKRIEVLENEKAVWEDLFTKGMIEDVDTFVTHLEEKFGVVVGTMENARDMLKNFTADLVDTTNEAAKGISYNNSDIELIQTMKNNSTTWGNSDLSQSRKQVHSTNSDLAKKLSFEVHFDEHKGVWLDEDGNNIYDRLETVDLDAEENNEAVNKNSETVKENTNKVDKNSETVKENTDTIQQSTNTSSENIKSTKENSEAIKDGTSTQVSANKQSKALNTNLTKFNDTMQDTTDSVDNLADKLNKSTDKSSSNSSSSSDASSSVTNATTNGTPYIYQAQLTSSDEDIAKEWFAQKHLTYSGSDVKVIHGGVSAMSSSLISELNLSNGDLVVLGKQLYRITHNGWNKISGSLTNAYAKGSKYIPYSQMALVDENGEEIIAHKNAQGRITQLEKGDEVVPAKDTQTLVSLVDYVNDPKNADNPMVETWGKLLKAQQTFINTNLNTNINNPFEGIVKNALSNLPNVTANNSTTSINYNVQKVELNNVNNAEDLFRGIENLARQRSMRR